MELEPRTIVVGSCEMARAAYRVEDFTGIRDRNTMSELGSCLRKSHCPTDMASHAVIVATIIKRG